MQCGEQDWVEIKIRWWTIKMMGNDDNPGTVGLFLLFLFIFVSELKQSKSRVTMTMSSVGEKASNSKSR